jgi:hypothetical protein
VLRRCQCVFHTALLNTGDCDTDRPNSWQDTLPGTCAATTGVSYNKQ